jgi:hypothetical protein
MPNDKIAVLDATSAHLSVFEIPAGMQHEDIEAHLAELGYALNNCDWQITTSMTPCRSPDCMTVAEPYNYHVSKSVFRFMDKETFEAFQEIITFAQRTHCDVHPDAHYKAFQKVFAWMREAQKDIDDLESLGADGPRRRLKSANS